MSLKSFFGEIAIAHPIINNVAMKRHPPIAYFCKKRKFLTLGTS